MPKTKKWTYCDDELIDDPETQAYINDPQWKRVIDTIHATNRDKLPRSHVRITSQSLKLVKKLKEDCDIEAFPAQFRFTGDKCYGGSGWYMYRPNDIGSIGSDYPVRDLITCKGKFTVDNLDPFDLEIYPTEEDMMRLNKKFIEKFNRKKRQI